MKKYLSIVIVLFVTYPIFSQKVNFEKANKSKNVEYLSTSAFKQKVFDYTQSKTWHYKGKLPAIIDFYADWCRPCKIISPYLEELAIKYEGKIFVYKVNTDKERELARIFGINSIPSVLFIPKIGQPQMMIGAYPKDEYEKQINNILKVRN